MKNKELELLASLKKACRLMDEIGTFKNEIALAEVQEYLKAIRFKSLWYVDFERENKGLKTSLHNRETDLAHYKGYLTK